MRTWVPGLPALMIFLGIGLLFVTTVSGFVPVIYWIALPLGLLLLVTGAVALAVKLWLFARE